MIINFGSILNDPAATIRGYLQSGYNNGTWTGTGITSSNAAANPGLYAVGYADGGYDNNGVAAGTQVVVEFALAGDANLDGLVNFSDLLLVAQDYGRTGQDWADGDFNYDGLVNFSDLLLVAQNYGKQLSRRRACRIPGSFAAQWQLAQTEISTRQSVPEPAAPGLLALAAAAWLTRRRNLARCNSLPPGRSYLPEH